MEREQRYSSSPKTRPSSWPYQICPAPPPSSAPATAGMPWPRRAGWRLRHPLLIGRDRHPRLRRMFL